MTKRYKNKIASKIILVILCMISALLIVHLLTAPARKGSVGKQIKGSHVEGNLTEGTGPVEVDVPFLGTMRVVPKAKK